MKCVEVFRDYTYRPSRQWSVTFKGGLTYKNVIEAAASAIVADGAGRILPPVNGADPLTDVDAWNAWTRRTGKRG